MPTDATPDAERVRSLLRYNSDTGYFYWLASGKGHRRMQEAGCIRPDGRRVIAIDGRQYYAHRLAWLATHGDWPEGDLDHKNGNPDDNRIANLREIDDAGNAQNKHRPQSNNTTGHLGVSRRSNGRWRADITVDGVRHRLGSFDTAEEAAAAYLAAKAELHPYWHRTSA